MPRRRILRLVRGSLSAKSGRDREVKGKCFEKEGADDEDDKEEGGN
jgi:hypothetical protein